MFRASLEFLACPRDRGPLAVADGLAAPTSECERPDIASGTLVCTRCHSSFPIIRGVAVLVPDLWSYCANYAKDLTRLLAEGDFPAPLRPAVQEGLHNPGAPASAWDGDVHRVTAWYTVRHFLGRDAEAPWWTPSYGPGSGFLEELVQRYWTHGPYAKLHEFLDSHRGDCRTLVDLGSSVGGGVRLAWQHGLAALGVDIEFPAVLAARQLLRGAPAAIPDDRLLGTRPWALPAPPTGGPPADFVVGDLSAPPLKPRAWDVAVCFNVLDLVHDPVALPAVVRRLLSPHGHALHACPYLWSDEAAQRLRALVPPAVRDSARAAEWLFERAGFTIQERDDDLPWVLFKHPRQLDAYSVHYFVAAPCQIAPGREGGSTVGAPRRLDILALGPGGPSHMTRRAHELLAQAERVFTLTAVAGLAGYLAGLGVEHVVDLSTAVRPLVSPEAVLEYLVDRILEDDDGGTSAVLVVEADAPVRPFPVGPLRAAGARRGWTVVVHPAVSALDTLLPELDLEELAVGLCVLDVPRLLDRQAPLVSSIATLLLQLGGCTPGPPPANGQPAAGRLDHLSAYLQRSYPAEHPVVVLCSAVREGESARRFTTTVGQLPACPQEIGRCCAAYLPPLRPAVRRTYEAPTGVVVTWA